MKIRGFEVCSYYANKDISLPIRKTKNSVGYDIEAAEDTVIPSIWKTVFKNITLFLKNNKEYEEIKPTLKGLIMSNSIGIIESDYYDNESNEGHLMFMYYNIGFKDITIKKGETAGQAYFQKFLIADNDKADGKRNGGFGSTN